jgi:hypothetical protein
MTFVLFQNYQSSRNKETTAVKKLGKLKMSQNLGSPKLKDWAVKVLGLDCQKRHPRTKEDFLNVNVLHGLSKLKT